MKMNKQFLIIVAIGVIIVGLIIYFIYYESTKSKPVKSPSSTSGPSSQIDKVLDEKIIFPAIDQEGKNVVYFSINEQKDLAFYRYNLITKEENKISDSIDVPDNIIWSPDRGKAILKVIYNKYVFEKFDSVFADPSLQDKQETTWFYDFSAKKLSRLNLNIQNIAWLDNDHIVYYLSEGDNINAIFLANPDGSSWEKITDIGFIEGVGLFPITPQDIFYYPIIYEAGTNNVFRLDIKTKQISEIIKDKAAGQILATSKDKILYQIAHEKENNFTLGIINKDGSGKKDFGLLSDGNKVTFSEKGDFVFVAVRQANNSTDSLYKINADSGQKEELKYESQSDIEAQNLFISKDNQTLYFTSNDNLYKIGL